MTTETADTGKQLGNQAPDTPGFASRIPRARDGKASTPEGHRGTSVPTRSTGARPTEVASQSAGPPFQPDKYERILAVAQGSLMTDLAEGAPDPGTVVISDQRVVHLGGSATMLPLDSIRDARPIRDRVLLDMGDGGGVVLDTPDPGILTEEINVLRDGPAD